MSQRRFIIILVLWVVLAGIAATDLGGMIGFLAAMSLAMFGGATATILHLALSALGFDIEPDSLLTVLIVAPLALILGAALWSALKGAMRWRSGDADKARTFFAQTMSIVGGCLVVWLGMVSLERTWPM